MAPGKKKTTRLEWGAKYIIYDNGRGGMVSKDLEGSGNLKVVTVLSVQHVTGYQPCLLQSMRGRG